MPSRQTAPSQGAKVEEQNAADSQPTGIGDFVQ